MDAASCSGSKGAAIWSVMMNRILGALIELCIGLDCFFSKTLMVAFAARSVERRTGTQKAPPDSPLVSVHDDTGFKRIKKFTPKGALEDYMRGQGAGA
jgi:hypothetical protein